MSAAAGALNGRRALVTGGTGFIGARVCELLCDSHGARPRVLVRDLRNAARVARYPVDFVPGDLLDPVAVRRAMRGCQLVVHCAHGTKGPPEQRHRVTVQGTLNVLDAARRERVERLVHLSSMMVYGAVDGELEESMPRQPSDHPYARAKLEAEEAILDHMADGRVRACVLQPTTVYGPFGGGWTAGVIEQLRLGTATLIEGGRGLCTPLYVDDLVDAIVLALTREEAVGQMFLVGGPETVTWRDFYDRFETMLGREGTRSVTVDEALREWRTAGRRRSSGLLPELLRTLRSDSRLRRRLLASREGRLLRSVGRALVPGPARRRLQRRLRRPSDGSDRTHPGALSRQSRPAARPLAPFEIAFLAARTTVRSGKAKRLLGYVPSRDLSTGMARAERWARWARLLAA